MSEFSVDLDHLDHIVAKLEALAGFVHDHLDDLDKGVTKLPEIWKSLGAQGYADAHREWADGAREFADGVREMSAAAEAAHRRYTVAMRANGRMLRGS
ncbi:WXG100 family type VII secretion target [Nocardia panacis]|uniref:WXG100 family type VII secretion target n=1 Tax=Nocardia panacis TaxID=2340916 RepID=A0A3A4JX83_9NOCA|nr:WXG100 family type VII secretion target [Nocardia panacis]RJO75219.1 WXG100 family type VII secretion target [Nocardia panacis]